MSQVEIKKNSLAGGGRTLIRYPRVSGEGNIFKNLINGRVPNSPKLQILDRIAQISMEMEISPFDDSNSNPVPLLALL